jgi:hypothetical protein
MKAVPTQMEKHQTALSESEVLLKRLKSLQPDFDLVSKINATDIPECQKRISQLTEQSKANELAATKV